MVLDPIDPPQRSKRYDLCHLDIGRASPIPCHAPAKDRDYVFTRYAP